MPFVIVVALPRLIRNRLAGYDTHWPSEQPVAGIGRVLGATAMLTGLALFAWCVSLFTHEGRGTIMPWDPTQRLVVRGPYRHVRNPMISSVLFMVAGQALWWGSWLTGALAAFFFAVNHIYFIKSEEPGLEKRFGESYRQYETRVPRWLPRLNP
jgi:protein-S-isoprenylcysteine O-methyltransferase Ste14